MVFRYISSKFKQINSHILFGLPWLMHLLLSGQEFNPQKTNKQSNENKEIIHFFYQIALFILFSIWKRSAHFVFEALRIQVAVQSKLKTNKQKQQTTNNKQQTTNNKPGGTSYIVFYDRSFKLRCCPFFWSKYWSKVILLTGNCCGQHKLKKQ